VREQVSVSERPFTKLYISNVRSPLLHILRSFFTPLSASYSLLFFSTRSTPQLQFAMGQLYAPEPKVRIHIDFLCDLQNLRDSIKAAAPDYNAEDPKTWPLASSLNHRSPWYGLNSSKKLHTR